MDYLERRPPEPVAPNFDVHTAFQAAPYGLPPRLIASRNYVHRMRVTSYLWLALWLPGIFLLVRGINAAGAALILGSLLVVVIYRIQRWRRGWRPWRIFGDIYPRT